MTVSAKWRSDPVTEKQKNFINELYKYDELNRIPKFTGKTKGEAYDFMNAYSRYAFEASDDFIDVYARYAYEIFDNKYLNKLRR